MATIKGLRESDETYCNYPARRKWLEKKGFSFPQRECSAFEEWTRGHSIKSISLIFASGFLGNPASYFGHPLIKFNFKDERSPLDLLDTAINYGAFTPPEIGAIPYAFYGIFGGFEAGFTSADFFFHKNNYSELELRDLWEYELLLDDEQVAEVVNHVWEMQRAKIPYYFFSDNCAFRISELLELVLDKQLISKSVPYAIPATLFHRIHENGLVKNIKLLPSRQTRLREKVFSLKASEKSHLTLLTEDVNHLQDESFKKLSAKKRARILEAGLDYFSYRLILDEDKEKLKLAKRAILKERFALPPGRSRWQTITQHPPHEAQRPVLTQWGYFYSEKFKSSGSFRFRPAFYDLISPDTGRPHFSALSAFDVELNFNDERIWLNRFTLMSVETLNISKTGLYKDGGFAWRFRLGAEQVNLACNTCTVALFEAGVGKAWELTNNFTLFTMLDPRIQSEYKDHGHLSATPSLGLLLTLSENFRLHSTGGKRFYLNKESISEDIFSVEGRLGSNRKWDIRMKYDQHVDRRYSVGFGYYW
ncbi:MAG: DUF4105 domain-containing protein [Bacteriovoracia bacterium]